MNGKLITSEATQLPSAQVSNRGCYRTIVCDPPWAYEGMALPWYSKSEPSYDVMPLAAIKALPVESLADVAAHLYLWCVLPLIAEAHDVVRAWGFRPCSMLTWCKPGPGLGGGYRGNTEHLIVARRGSTPSINPTCAECGGRDRGAKKCYCAQPEWRHKGEAVPPCEPPFLSTAGGTWYTAPRGEHSAKPELFLDLIERMSPPPRLEMFARRQRLGWDTYGNEALAHVEIEGAA